MTVKVIADSSPESPREWDNVGTMLCKHGRYELGDKDADISDLITPAIKEGDAKELRPIVRECLKRDRYAIDNLRQYLREGKADRGGRTESLRLWLGDYVSDLREDEQIDLCRPLIDAVAEVLPCYLYDHSGITMSTGRFSCPWDSGLVGFIWATHKTATEKGVEVEKLAEVLEGEVAVYAQYLEGDVYGFSIEDGDYENSCWGFYGLDPKKNGMLEHVEEKYHEALIAAADSPEYPRH